LAAAVRPEIAIETDAIEHLYKEIRTRRPEMLHPNSMVLREETVGSP